MARRSFGARLGARLRAQREALGWTQARLAEKTGVTSNYIGVLERGLKLPTLDTLVLLAKALDMSPAALLGDVRPRDQWLDDVLAVASTIPESRRGLALAVLKALATWKSGGREGL
jgi:transcriptional regulator with XRE-family HTH domain